MHGRDSESLRPPSDPVSAYPLGDTPYL